MNLHALKNSISGCQLSDLQAVSAPCHYTLAEALERGWMVLKREHHWRFVHPITAGADILASNDGLRYIHATDLRV